VRKGQLEFARESLGPPDADILVIDITYKQRPLWGWVAIHEKIYH
jgi:hypothetical protein